MTQAIVSSAGDRRRHCCPRRRRGRLGMEGSLKSLLLGLLPLPSPEASVSSFSPSPIRSPPVQKTSPRRPLDDSPLLWRHFRHLDNGHCLEGRYGILSSPLSIPAADTPPAPSLHLNDWTGGQVAGCVLGVAGGVVALSAIFLLPFLYRRLVLDDWTLKSWQVIYGPLLWWRGDVPPVREGVNQPVVQDYYRGHKNANQDPMPAQDIDAVPQEPNDVEKQAKSIPSAAAVEDSVSVSGSGLSLLASPRSRRRASWTGPQLHGARPGASGSKRNTTSFAAWIVTL